MRAAVNLARRGLGQTAPNPSVGCVIVKDGLVVGRGHTAPGGRPHAEVQALAMAGTQARKATAYVTLEPCSFTGKTGPCTDALTAAGITRVIIGATDPHPKVNGAGVQKLRAQGIEVIENVLREECEELIAGFAMTISENRPLITLKLASSLDGKIATARGESQWITGEAARRGVHALRARHDAVLAGVGTVLADNPDLTCRIEGFRTTPITRIVVDSHLRTPLLSQLVRGAAQNPLWILHRNGTDKHRIKALETAGVKLIELPAAAAGIDLVAGMEALAKHGLTRVMVEGGGTIAAALLREQLVDRLAWFHAPCIMGADGWPAAQAFGICTLAQMPRFTLLAQHRLGSDIMSEYKKA